MTYIADIHFTVVAWNQTYLFLLRYACTSFEIRNTFGIYQHRNSRS